MTLWLVPQLSFLNVNKLGLVKSSLDSYLPSFETSFHFYIIPKTLHNCFWEIFHFENSLYFVLYWEKWTRKSSISFLSNKIRKSRNFINCALQTEVERYKNIKTSNPSSFWIDLKYVNFEIQFLLDAEELSKNKRNKSKERARSVWNWKLRVIKTMNKENELGDVHLFLWLFWQTDSLPICR